MFDTRIGELDGEQVLDFVEGRHRDRTEADVDIFVAAAHFADVHNGDTLDSRGRVLPGMEIARRLGGPGTPRVAEFCAAELGARIGVHPIGASNLIADALDVRHRLRGLWSRLTAGEVPVWVGRKIASMTRGLSLEQAEWLDGQVTPYADSLGWGRLLSLTEAKVVEADPEAADARARAAETERFVTSGRTTEHGLKILVARATAGDVCWFVAMVDRIADALAALQGDTDPVGVRRSRAIGILANPLRAVALLEQYAAHQRAERARQGDGSPAHSSGGEAPDDDADRPVGEADVRPADNDADDPPTNRCPACCGDPTVDTLPDLSRLDPAKLLPPVTLYVHVSAETLAAGRGVARLEEVGALTLTQVREFFGPHARIALKSVIDLANQAPVDAYEIPDRHREAVRLRTPADAFPFASNTGRGTDLDHVVPWRPPEADGGPGQTGPHNLAPMTRFHHRIKTFGRWLLRQPFPGIYLWRDPHGIFYLVDHTGTHRLPNARSPDNRRHGPDIEIEFYPSPFPLDLQINHAA